MGWVVGSKKDSLFEIKKSVSIKEIRIERIKTN